MSASVLTHPQHAAALLENLRPQPLADGTEPEERLVYAGLGWEGYLALDKALGDDRPDPRLYYLDGDVEIMSTSEEHERLQIWITAFVDEYLLNLEPEVIRRGKATMRKLKQAGAEPDDAWNIGGRKEWPDIVLEIALTSGGLPKLAIYQRFGVPEVWMWRRGRLEFHGLSTDASGYERLDTSRLLPELPLALLDRCLAIKDWRAARKTFREGLR